MKIIPVFKPSITEKEIHAVSAVMRSGWLGLGPKTEEFEKAFARYVGSRFAVGLNSGTAALHLALKVAGIRKGDEVIVPAITFVSTAHAAVYNGARVVFADIVPDTLCIDVNDVRKKISSRTRAIIPVHYGGHPAELDEIHRLCRHRNITVIEDAAHACGARYKNRRIGSISPLTCFSFHAVKNLTCGEGGMVTTDDEKLYRRLKELRWMGISKDTWMRSVTGRVYAWQYWVNELGYKEHLSDLCAALGLVQLSRLEEMNRRRRAIVAFYNRAFKEHGCLSLPVEKPYVRSSWHIYHLKTSNRDEFIGFLKSRGIAPGVHYYPINLHPYYLKRRQVCPVAENIWRYLISLPLYPDLTATDRMRVVRAVKDFARVTDWESVRLDGRKVILRPLASGDLELLRRWRNRNKRFFFDQTYITAQMQEKWFDRYLKDAFRERVFVIYTKEEVPVGSISLGRARGQSGVMELGRMIIGEDAFRAQGLAADSVRTLLRSAFRDPEVKRIFLEVFRRNYRAFRLYRACGFKRVNGSVRSIRVGGVKRDIIRMELVRESLPNEKCSL